MSTLSNILYLGAGTAIKMVAGFGTLVVLARVLGAHGFGALMIWMSAAGVLCILSNLGINTYLLREIGRAPEAAAEAISDALTAKLLLMGAALVVATVVAAVWGRFADRVFALLLLALLVEGFTEFLNVCLRATGRFSIETKQSFMAALVYSITISVTALASGALWAVAAAYLASRLLITVVAWTTVRRLVGKIQPAALRVGLKRIRATASYSVDAALSALFGQVDGLVLGAHLSAAAVGVYQGGLRIYMAATTGAGILTNVLLPKVSADMAEGVRATALNDRVILAFSLFGCVVGGLIAVLVPHFVVALYGQGFEALIGLLPWFGILFAARLVAGAWGVLLTAAGQQRYRTHCALVHWVLIAAAAFFAIPAWGSLGWLIAMLAGTSVLCLLYIVRGARMVANLGVALAASSLPLALLVYVACR